MKLKFLTFFMVLGLFALGTPVKAVEEDMPREDVAAPAALGDPAGTLLCSALKALAPKPSNTQNACYQACYASNPNITDLGPCIGWLVANAKNFSWIQPVLTKVRSACKGATCSGKPFGGTCKVKVVRTVCGEVCCNIEPTDVTSCMTNNKDNCSNYIDKPSVEDLRKITW